MHSRVRTHNNWSDLTIILFSQQFNFIECRLLLIEFAT